MNRTRVFREADETDGGDVDLEDVTDVDERESSGDDSVKILCDTCRHELTSGEASTRVDGAHRHVKVNPRGHVFHIRCFQPVPGVIAIGQPSEEFTWFAGYRWQIALCASCQVHVGWAFSGNGEFGALIQDRIVEESQDQK